MKAEEYYKELELIMGKLQKAHKNKDSKKISEYTTLLNELWKKGGELRFEAMIKDGFIPPTKN